MVIMSTWQLEAACYLKIAVYWVASQASSVYPVAFRKGMIWMELPSGWRRPSSRHATSRFAYRGLGLDLILFANQPGFGPEDFCSGQTTGMKFLSPNKWAKLFQALKGASQLHP